MSHRSRRGQVAAPQDEFSVPRMLRSAKRCAADPASSALRIAWVPALRCIVKNAAPRPGHGTHCFTASQNEGRMRSIARRYSIAQIKATVRPHPRA